MVEALWGDADDRISQLKGLWMAHLEGRGVVQLCRLLGNGLDDLGPAVAGIDTPEASGAVEDLPAIGRGVVHVLGAHEHARRLLELAIGSERHPERAQIVRRDVLAIGHAETLPRNLPAYPFSLLLRLTGAPVCPENLTSWKK